MMLAEILIVVAGGLVVAGIGWAMCAPRKKNARRSSRPISSGTGRSSSDVSSGSSPMPIVAPIYYDSSSSSYDSGCSDGGGSSGGCD
jgi:hypothetical protein